MSESVRDRLCWAGALLVLLCGVLTWVSGHPSTGIAMGTDSSGRVVVTEVAIGSTGWMAGVKPGMEVRSSEDPIRIVVDALSGQTARVPLYVPAQGLIVPALWGAVLLLTGAWSIRHLLPSQSFFGPFVAPFALVGSVPLFLVPAVAFGSPVSLLISGLAWPLSAIPLAWLTIDQSQPGRARHRVRIVVAGAIASAVAFGTLSIATPTLAVWGANASQVLVGIALLAPVGLLAAGRLQERDAWVQADQRVTQLLCLTALAVTPLVLRSATSAASPGEALFVAMIWASAAVAVTGMAVTILTRLATRATRQRDMVADAAAAERSQIASDLHDGPLQALALLAYRLDAAGDLENASLARDVATELRAVTTSLRLPVVDDLGAGPALEWLTSQVAQLSGMEIGIERVDDGRPPLEVEHAFYRVAQEALSNAARHGLAPIFVRYESGPERATLMVADAGSAGAPDRATSDGVVGHGMTSMRERANAVGATLDIGLAPAGSRVVLVWPAGAT